MSQWLYAGLAEAGLPVICVEAQHMRSALAAQRNKTDRNDARGIAQMMRVGLYRPVHIKTPASQERRLLLTARKLLQAKMLDLEAEVRGTLKNFGLRVGVVGKGGFRQRVRELIAGREALDTVITMAPAKLEAWIERARATLIASFVHGVAKDEAAVCAAMTLPWSNGQTEGQITKLKLVKRQMYGRDKIDLLQARLIGAAS
jgi:transposase